MNLNTHYLFWHNTKDGPLFCGNVYLEGSYDELYLSCYGERLAQYFDHPLTGYLELAEPYGFPVLNFDKVVIYLPGGPKKDDEPFIFHIKPLLKVH
jgi:hypothetical protein